MSTINYRQLLRQYYKDNLTLPSIRRFCELLGKGDTYRTQAKRVMDRLVGEEFLQQDETGKYVPGTGFFSIPLYHGISAGGFAMTGEQSGSLNLLQALLPDPATTISITVNGDSMIEAGIDNGDIVIVDLDKPYKEDDIVVAETGGELTVKYFQMDSLGTPYLQPANQKYSRIEFGGEQEVHIIGVVTRCIKYFQ